MEVAVVSCMSDLDVYESEQLIASTVTDWATVTEEEYNLLKWWTQDYYSIQGPFKKTRFFIIKKENEQLPTLIKTCLKLANDHKAEIEKEQKVKEEKQRLIKEKRDAKKRAKLLKEIENDATLKAKLSELMTKGE